MSPESASSRYETLEVIGAGGMATVWRARDRELDRFVALKRPHPSPDDSVTAARFRREAKSAAAVSHPNLVTVYDVGADEDGPFLVMELLDAPSLAETTVPADGVRRVATEIASALAALHAADIVHRDIKPANIMLTDGGAQLTDFGIAKSLSDAETLTQAGTTFATPAYAAPEVVSGGEYTEASDVYALATVLRELVAGRRIIPNDATQVMVTDLTWQPLLDPCLSTDPASRPSAAGFLATLQGVGATATVPMATPPNPSGARVQRTQVLPVMSPSLPGARAPGAARPRRSPLGIFVVGLLVLGLAAMAFAAARDDGSIVEEAALPDTALNTATTAAAPVDASPETDPPATAALPISVDTAPVPEPTPAPTASPPTESPPTGLPVDDVTVAVTDLENFIEQIRGATISDKDADKLIDDLGKLRDAVRDDDERNIEKRLESVADRIEDKVDDAAARSRANELLDVVLQRLGVELDDRDD